MIDTYIGEVHLFSFSYAPAGWVLCDGSTLPKYGNDLLFSLLGYTYGGDGRTKFALPNLNAYNVKGGANFGPNMFLCYYIATMGIYPTRSY